MLTILAKLFTSRAGLVGMAIAAVLALFGVQALRLKLAEAGETHAKAIATAASASLAASERLRASEHRAAVAAVSEAETACAARVAQALKTGTAIHKLVGAPVVTDPQSHCPLRRLFRAGELRDALTQHP